MTDFKTWQRETLEQFARDAAADNLQLKADVQTLLAAWRNELQKEKQK